MKTGVIALTAASLVGSALAVPGDYGAWPASSSSSTPAAPVKASSTEPCDEDSYDATSSGSAAWPEWTASSSASSSAAAWGYVSSSTTVKASSSTKSFATSSATWGSGAWGSAVADSVAPSSVPAWFDPASAYACCKTVVTETVYGSSTYNFRRELLSKKRRLTPYAQCPPSPLLPRHRLRSPG